MSRLMIKEDRSKQSEQVTALVSGSKVTKHQKEIKCFKCDKAGHIKRNCPQLKLKYNKKWCHHCKKSGHLTRECWFDKKKRDEEDKSSNNVASTSKSTQAFVGESSLLNYEDMSAFIGQSETSENDWWLDSGATEHMCYDIEKFQEVRKLQQDRVVKVGNGTLLKVQGVGKVAVQAWNGQQWLKTELHEVLLVPDLDVNLFSLSTVLDKGFRIHSDKDHCKILDSEGNIRARAERQGNLYKMCFKPESVSPRTSQGNVAKSLVEWHRKLAHINFDRVRNVLKRNSIMYKEIQKPFCKDCLAGKQHRLPFPTSKSRSEIAGELIHGDLCGPFEVSSLGGSKYFLMLKDDFSGFRFAYFFKE